MCEKLLLFFYFHLPCLKYICKWKKAKDLELLYKKGKKKIEQELNVIRLIRNMNFIKIFMKNSVLTEKITY